MTVLPDDPKKPWFSSTPVGKNTLAKIVKEVCHEGGIAGRKMNHSLCVTHASNMYQAGVPEKLIQKVIAHM